MSTKWEAHAWNTRNELLQLLMVSEVLRMLKRIFVMRNISPAPNPFFLTTTWG